MILLNACLFISIDRPDYFFFWSFDLYNISFLKPTTLLLFIAL